MKDIKNIYCVAKNYLNHVKEFDSVAPESPLFFMKPTHAAVFLEDQRQIRLPDDQGAVHYELELAVCLKRSYEEGLPLEEIIDGVGLGIDFTLRDKQWEAKEAGNPWFSAKGFKNSAVLTQMIPFESEAWFSQLAFSLEKNGALVQEGKSQTMIFPLKRLLQSCDAQFATGAGDILFTGTPEGVGPVVSGDKLKMTLEGKFTDECTIA